MKMDYWDAVDYLLALPDLERFSAGPQGRVMSLDAMKALLNKLGNPELGRRTIHVTGSKGKGSTSTMIASILHESGFRCGLFTSPHLHDYVERIAFDLLPVSRFDFADAVGEMRAAIDEVNNSSLGPISTFGALTALFFVLCRKNNIDWQIVEVGLGGARDATNVFSKKDIAVITAISLEHTQILGNSCAEIVREKAGIITPGCKTVLGKQKDPTVLPVVADVCRAKSAELFDVGAQVKIIPVAHDSNGQSFVLEMPERTYKLHSTMLGIHQLENAATAVSVANLLMKGTAEIDNYSVEDGIANAEINGRIEQLTRHPITVVDGAHNGESMGALVDAVSRHFDFDDAIFILGVNGDKNIEQIAAALKPIEPKMVICTRSQSQKAMEPETILKAISSAGMQARLSQNISDAIDMAREFADLNDLVCITGSIYVAGEARQRILALPVTN